MIPVVTAHELVLPACTGEIRRILLSSLQWIRLYEMQQHGDESEDTDESERHRNGD